MKPSTKLQNAELKDLYSHSIFEPIPSSENPTNTSPYSKTQLFVPTPKHLDLESLGSLQQTIKLSKKSRILGIQVSRYYFLYQTHLLCAKVNNPAKAHKSTELKDLKVWLPTASDNDVTTYTQNHISKNYSITLFRSQTMAVLTTDSYSALEEMRQHLGKSCILLGFHDYYNIISSLGTGYYGKVYLATSKTNGKNYAVKVFEKVYPTPNPQNYTHIINEVEVLRKVHHINIAELCEVYESSKHVYLVLEYVQGGELGLSLQQKKFVNEEEIVHIMKDILNALQYLHTEGLIHRDIKPENLMLTSEKDGMRVKLVDFGFAGNIKAGRRHLRYCGTHGYIAPEVFNSPRPLCFSGKNDIFALGAVFFQLLTGQKFKGEVEKVEDDDEIIEKIDTWYILNPGKMSWTAKDLLLKMLKYNPDERISASQALQHPFFGNNNHNNTVNYQCDTSLESAKIRRTHNCLEETVNSETQGVNYHGKNRSLFSKESVSDSNGFGSY